MFNGFRISRGFKTSRLCIMRDVLAAARWAVGLFLTRLCSLSAAACLLVAAAAGCTGSQAEQRALLLGAWQSSKLVTPLYLYDNGEWEIKKDDGAVLQYGLWHYKDKKITWTHRAANALGQEVNAVVRLQPNQFELREADQSLTVFNKLGAP